MTDLQKNIYLVGSASGLAASYSGTGDGPIALQKSPYMNLLADNGLTAHWQKMHIPQAVSDKAGIRAAVIKHNQDLAATVSALAGEHKFFTVLGGDHSCAIGTWSGAAQQVLPKGDLGLIWIDAHLDSHTMDTSETGNIHGMPLACLLGLGDVELANLASPGPKLKPEHVCVIGARSYEAGEVDNLEKLNVRVYYMEEIAERGLDAVMAEALTRVKTGTAAYGITIDIDSIDPREAPGTGVSEPGGLTVGELTQALHQLKNDPHLIGAEIVEFDPHLDKDALTEIIVPTLIVALRA